MPQTEKIYARRCQFAFEKFANRKYPIHASRYQKVNEVTDSQMHLHDFPQIWYCYAGSYTHIIDGKPYHCEKGSLIVIPPSIYHDLVYSEAYVDLLSMDIRWDFLSEFPKEKWLNPLFNLFSAVFRQELVYCTMLSEDSQKIAEECLDWFDVLKFAPSENVDQKEMYERIETLFSLPELAVGENTYNKNNQIIQAQLMPILRLVSYLNNHYHEKIKEEDVLQAAGISRRGMFRYFKRIIGFSYSDYLQLLRVKHVYTYLRTSTYTLTYISDACGFCDVRYMTQVFKKYLGETPRTRRKKLLAYYQKVSKNKGGN